MEKFKEIEEEYRKIKYRFLVKKIISQCEIILLFVSVFTLVYLILYFLISSKILYCFLAISLFFIVLMYSYNSFVKRINNYILGDKIYKKHRVLDLEYFYKVKGDIRKDISYSQFVYFIYNLNKNGIKIKDIKRYLRGYTSYKNYRIPKIEVEKLSLYSAYIGVVVPISLFMTIPIYEKLEIKTSLLEFSTLYIYYIVLVLSMLYIMIQFVYSFKNNNKLEIFLKDIIGLKKLK
ncbi:hypothetical protein [Aliarcobacter skirrowii]|uniref:hypothetical protein n=1 Tax=Aliarcobacter skirrowii TaxID=28200 RepID=UPI0021B2AE31|nr:hypothetical protein [Aliarcobacter skirrowii]MCT7445736.1 hypothetical protein [Aliarcobacter skirrowii]